VEAAGAEAEQLSLAQARVKPWGLSNSVGSRKENPTSSVKLRSSMLFLAELFLLFICSSASMGVHFFSNFWKET
jgi:hypothetical protein